ncbi:MAG: S41 family peptidase, partial [Terriglobales bacterium]
TLSRTDARLLFFKAQAEEITQPRVPYMAAHRPVIVLVDGDSCSATELFTGSLQDHAAVTVMGTRTMGKGVGQIDVNLPNSCSLHVTSGRYYSPRGRWFGDANKQANGIVPDVVVDPVGEFEYGSDDDNQLQAARQLLASKLRAA